MYVCCYSISQQGRVSWLYYYYKLMICFREEKEKKKRIKEEEDTIVVLASLAYVSVYLSSKPNLLYGCGKG